MFDRLVRSPAAMVCVTALALFGAHTLIAADALTQHYNNARTGAVLDELRLTTSTVNASGFGKLWTLYADGQIVQSLPKPDALTVLVVSRSSSSTAPVRALL